MDAAAVLEIIGEQRASAILRTDDRARAKRAMAAAVAGGFRVIEFTLTVPGALDLIAEFSDQPELVVGAGTVLDIDQVRDAVAAGARYIVSPVVDPLVIAATRALGVVSMPGTATPTEMLVAHRAGAQLCKLFPAPAGGPGWVRSVLGPMPFLRVVPTNGVDAGNVGQWLAAGAFAAGFVASLFDGQDLARGDFNAIEARAKAIVAAVADARSA